jgi:hypothetical protein
MYIWSVNTEMYILRRIMANCVRVNVFIDLSVYLLLDCFCIIADWRVLKNFFWLYIMAPTKQIARCVVGLTREVIFLAEFWWFITGQFWVKCDWKITGDLGKGFNRLALIKIHFNRCFRVLKYLKLTENI